MHLIRKYVEDTIERYNIRYLYLLITAPDGKACRMVFTGKTFNFGAPVDIIESNINSILCSIVDSVNVPDDIKTSIIKVYDVLDDAELTTRVIYYIHHPERLFMSRSLFLDSNKALQLNIRSIKNRIYFFMEYAGEEEVLTIKTI